jgi:hypothetical protein
MSQGTAPVGLRLLWHLCPVPPLTVYSLLGPQGNFGEAGPAGSPVSMFWMAIAWGKIRWEVLPTTGKLIG